MQETGDFTADPRLIFISAIALVIGAVCTLVAVALMWLIGFFTNLFFYHQLAVTFRSPAENQLGWAVVVVPVIGGIIIGLMARYGSERIRGHGIPEAMEAILIGQSRMQAKVAVLKPVSSAISIGSGGPFGAEGPIIMTGGAFGSLIAQAFHLSAAERKTLLVAGAAGGMSATFATPVAAAMLAVELLLFEWKPRSVVPVALSSALAATVRQYLIGPGPLFPVPAHPPLAAAGLLSAVLVGLLAGGLSALLTAAVYAAEDTFMRLPIHWMWWPAIGGLAVGVGGLIQAARPRCRVRYHSRAASRRIRPEYVGRTHRRQGGDLGHRSRFGNVGRRTRSVAHHGWRAGCARGAATPGRDARAVAAGEHGRGVGGTMRSPFTSVIFALELTHDVDALLPLLIASMVAYAFTVLVMKRSILTEKVSRRGYHLSREYSVDPLERLKVKEVMSRDVIAVPLSMRVKDLLARYFDGRARKHQGYPVVNDRGQLIGIVTRSNLLEPSVSEAIDVLVVADIVERELVVAYTEESCRQAAEAMAQAGVGRLPVVAEDNPRQLVGIVTRSDLLKPRSRSAHEEHRRERFIRLQPLRRKRVPEVKA